ncbi:hypothetical protein FSP39_001262 [Pinctada imbricata]|uniref:Uncharacterized protein n=1 Tax=Pinctada imbricata TaxID=66713 RepID=A0AA89BY98_PINIB|nr:hypothetical protein FSP39_001262 [Pinctada imbricata]
MSWMRKQFYVTSDSPKEISDQPSPRITPSSIFPAGHMISPQQTIGSQISRKAILFSRVSAKQSIIVILFLEL